MVNLVRVSSQVEAGQNALSTILQEEEFYIELSGLPESIVQRLPTPHLPQP
jgi:hypothetical protein